jgi:O-methyltransferase involved in polyketide biosynthesis
MAQGRHTDVGPHPPRAHVDVPSRVSWVPVDFDASDFEGELSSALDANGYGCGRGAVFVWEGVISYIDSEAIDRSLRFKADVGGTHSRLVLTFGEGSLAPDTAAERLLRMQAIHIRTPRS